METYDSPRLSTYDSNARFSNFGALNSPIGNSPRLSSRRLGDEISRSASVNSPGASGRYLSHVTSLPSEESLEAVSKAALEEIEKDAVFSKFLTSNFNSTKFASEVLSSGSALSSTRKLNEGISLLEKQLRSEVILRHEQLLQQLGSLRDTEAVLAVVRAGVDSLQASVQRVRAEVAEPYKQVKQKTRQLANLHSTVELMRGVIRVLKLIRRLRDHLSQGLENAELAKAAQLYADISEVLRADADLAGVELVGQELSWHSQVGQEISTEAFRGLQQGLASMNQAEIGGALQVFFNMGELKPTVDQILNKNKSQAVKAVASAFDLKAISQSTGPTSLMSVPGSVARTGVLSSPQNPPKAREVLWSRFQSSLEAVRALVAATWQLQRVLAKKRDPISHLGFLEVAIEPPAPLLTSRLWQSFASTVSGHLKSTLSASPFLRENLVAGFPRLLEMLDNLLEGIYKDTGGKGGKTGGDLGEKGGKGVPPGVTEEDWKAVLGAFEPLQNMYLSQSMARTTELINALLPAGGRGPLPSSESVTRLVRHISTELAAVRSSSALSQQVVKSIGKGLGLLAERAEFQVNMSPESRQLAGPASSAQQRNLGLCVFLEEVQWGLEDLLANGSLPAGTEVEVEGGMEALRSVASAAVAPLFTAMVEKVEQEILLLHSLSEVDHAPPEGEGAPVGPSRYMRQVVNSLSLFRKEFLSRLPSSSSPSTQATGRAPRGIHQDRGRAHDSISLALTKRLSGRILLFFLRQLSLVRPLSESLKLQLARDMSELEFALGSHLAPPEQLGAPYRALRAFRPLLFLDSGEIRGSPLLKDLPPSVVLHHLFSRAGEELKSPLQKNNLSPKQYSLWLDQQHSEEASWKEIKACLEAYARSVESRGGKEFDPCYPLILDLGKQFFHT